MLLKESTLEISEKDLHFKLDVGISSFLNELTENELEILEDSIKRNGCVNPIVVWKEENILLDGYHRLALCQKHKKTYKTTPISFPNRIEAKLWVFNNNKGRRGHGDSPFYDCEKVIEEFEEHFREIAKERKREAGKAHGRGQKKLPKLSQELVKAFHVDKELGKLAGYSAETIRMVRFIMKHGSDQAKGLLRERRSQHSIGEAYERARHKLTIPLIFYDIIKNFKKKDLTPQQIHKEKEIHEILRKEEKKSISKIEKDVEKMKDALHHINIALRDMELYDDLIDKDLVIEIFERKKLIEKAEILANSIEALKKRYSR